MMTAISSEWRSQKSGGWVI